MRLLPEGVPELDPNSRWAIATRLQLIEDVVLGPQDSGISTPTKEEATDRMRRAVEARDKKAEDEAIMDYMRAEVRAWWQDFPERQLLTDLYQRDARRRAATGSLDSRRLPIHEEGLRVAKGLLVDLPDTGPLDAEGEAETIARVLAGEGLVSNVVPSRREWRKFMNGSRSIRVHFDALILICEELDKQGEAIPGPLARWRQEVAEGRRKPPAMKPIPAHRPPNPAQFARDMHIQFAIAVLERVGVRPQGSLVSGCRIVAEASKLPDDTVVRIWKACTWRTSFEPAMQKYSKAIAKRTGLYPTH